jgi:hypothetical protein
VNPSPTAGPSTASAGRIPAPSATPTPQEPTPTPARREATAGKPTNLLATGLSAATVDDFFARCPTAAEIQSLLTEVPVAFETDPTAGTAACKASEGSFDLSPLQKRVYQSLLIMKNLTFDSPLPWTGQSLAAWFSGTINGIRIRADIQNSFCCDPKGVINIKIADNSYLMVTDRWIDPPLCGGLMDAMVLYVHEARHSEGSGHTCNAGIDDRTIGELGSWGVQYYLLQWLAQHSDPVFFRAPGGDPDLYRRVALDHMLSIRQSRFCDEPTLTPGATPTLSG